MDGQTIRHDCEICQGSGKIRLPIYRRAVAVAFDGAPMLEESSRSYACPECGGDGVPHDRIAIVTRHHDVVAHDEGGEDYIRHMTMAAAHRLIDQLLRGGFIRFEKGPHDPLLMTYPVRATVGVVSLGHVASMERRIAHHQEAVAREVVAEAAKQINSWGAYYGDTTVHKAQAVDSLHSALAAVLTKHPVLRAATTPPVQEAKR